MRPSGLSPPRLHARNGRRRRGSGGGGVGGDLVLVDLAGVCEPDRVWDVPAKVLPAALEQRAVVREAHGQRGWGGLLLGRRCRTGRKPCNAHRRRLDDEGDGGVCVVAVQQCEVQCTQPVHNLRKQREARHAWDDGFVVVQKLLEDRPAGWSGGWVGGRKV